MKIKQRQSQNIEIVDANIDCIDRLIKMYFACFTYTYGCSFFKSVLDGGCGFCYILRCFHNDCGFICGCFVYDEIHILNICILEKYRGRGFASFLLGKVFDLAVDKGVRSVILEVSVENSSAIRLYEKNGFKRIGLRRGYYRDREKTIDAYVYEMSIL